MERLINQLANIIKDILSTAHSLELLAFRITSSYPQIKAIKEENWEEKNFINSLPINSLEDIYRLYKEVIWYLDGRDGMEVINTLQEYPFNKELQSLGFKNLGELETATNNWVQDTNYRGHFS